MNIKETITLTSSLLFFMRVLLTIWCLLIVFMSSIIMKQRLQSKKLLELQSSLCLGAKVVGHNGFAGVVIGITKEMIVIELASGKKIELHQDSIHHVSTK